MENIYKTITFEVRNNAMARAILVHNSKILYKKANTQLANKPIVLYEI
jgi:prolyl-tRNA editing enzyme YbaK/EbsC (Cys-tRNA(Pro) deacylase)